MRTAAPTLTAPAVLPLTNADQRRLAILLAQLRAADPLEDYVRDPTDPVAVLGRLVAALPALRGRLPADQQQLLSELDQSEESLDTATNRLTFVLDSFAEWRTAPLDTSTDLTLYEEAVTQLSQAATEAALRAGQRRAVLIRAGDDSAVTAP
jgi:hypothetical protein